jgi:hypothetical protein
LKSTGNTAVDSHQMRLNAPAIVVSTPSVTFAPANQNCDVITILTPFCVPPNEVQNTWTVILVVSILNLSLPPIDKQPMYAFSKRHTVL